MNSKVVVESLTAKEDEDWEKVSVDLKDVKTAAADPSKIVASSSEATVPKTSTATAPKASTATVPKTSTATVPKTSTAYGSEVAHDPVVSNAVADQKGGKIDGPAPAPAPTPAPAPPSAATPASIPTAAPSTAASIPTAAPIETKAALFNRGDRIRILGRWGSYTVVDIRPGELCIPKDTFGTYEWVSESLVDGPTPSAKSDFQSLLPVASAAKSSLPAADSKDVKTGGGGDTKAAAQSSDQMKTAIPSTALTPIPKKIVSETTSSATELVLGSEAMLSKIRVVSYHSSHESRDAIRSIYVFVETNSLDGRETSDLFVVLKSGALIESKLKMKGEFIPENRSFEVQLSNAWKSYGWSGNYVISDKFRTIVYDDKSSEVEMSIAFVTEDGGKAYAFTQVFNEDTFKHIMKYERSRSKMMDKVALVSDNRNWACDLLVLHEIDNTRRYSKLIRDYDRAVYRMCRNGNCGICKNCDYLDRYLWALKGFF